MPVQELIPSPPAQHLLEPVGTGIHREQHRHLTRAGRAAGLAIQFPTHWDGLMCKPGIQATLHCLLLNFGVFPPCLECSVIHESTRVFKH